MIRDSVMDWVRPGSMRKRSIRLAPIEAIATAAAAVVLSLVPLVAAWRGSSIESSVSMAVIMVGIVLLVVSLLLGLPTGSPSAVWVISIGYLLSVSAVDGLAVGVPIVAGACLGMLELTFWSLEVREPHRVTAQAIAGRIMRVAGFVAGGAFLATIVLIAGSDAARAALIPTLLAVLGLLAALALVAWLARRQGLLDQS